MLTTSIDDLRLMLRLIRRDARLAAEPPAEAAVERLAAAAPVEGLSLALLHALDTMPTLPRPSAGRLRILDARRRRQEERTPLLLETLDRVTSRFAREDVPAILLKGPYFAERYSGGLSGREFVDLDLLVPAADRARASRLVKDAGCARRSRVLGSERLTSAFVHAFDYGPSGSGLDLHWCLSRHPSLRIDEGAIWAARRRVRVAGRDVEVLSDAHDIVFGVLSLLRDIERGRPKAKNMLDVLHVAIAADTTLDWSGFFDGGRRDGTRGPLVNVLALCVELADAAALVPRLTAALRAHGDRRAAARPTSSPFMFAPLRGGLGNKWWAARAYDTNVVAWAAWWAASLPFRLAVHRRPGAPSPQPKV